MLPQCWKIFLGREREISAEEHCNIAFTLHLCGNNIFQTTLHGISAAVDCIAQYVPHVRSKFNLTVVNQKQMQH